MGNFLCGSQDEDDGTVGQQPKPSATNNQNSAHPQQGLFQFREITFDSRIESGNLSKVARITPTQYNLFIAPDNWGTQFETKHRVWFYYKATNIDLHGQSSATYQFTIKNMNKLQLKNYRSGMSPVYCGPSTDNQWQYLPNGIRSVTPMKFCLEINFEFTFNQADAQNGVFFAFTFPYTYTDCQNMCNFLEDRLVNDSDIYFKRELVNYSLEKRRIDLLTLTWKCPDSERLNEVEKPIKNLFPGVAQSNQMDSLSNSRPIQFQKRRYIFLSCRVHPCETPSNFMLSEFLMKLIDKNDPLSQSLLKNYVFVVIPMVNPDGVFRGHYRTDTLGKDLNRSYASVNVQKHPGPLAVKKVAKSLGERMYMYLDLHSHSNKDSGFVFGNHTNVPETKALIRQFALLMDIHSNFFDLNSCGFGAPLKEGQKRSGVAKTEVGLETGCALCFTLESGYHLSRKDPHRYNPDLNPRGNLKKQHLQKLSIPEFNEIGDALRHALADMANIHPTSKLPKTSLPDSTALLSKSYELFGHQVEECEDG